MNHTIRDYTRTDEPSWLRCRVLAFLNTAYFDDVARTKPTIAAPGFELVAVDHATIRGLMDLAVEGELATIETVAVHPDHQHAGIGRALLAKAMTRIQAMSTVTTLDAWTRDDTDALRWYRAMGFRESDHYLHVYASHYSEAGELERAVASAQPGLHPVSAFLHANLADEERLRREFARVHVCRRFSIAL